MLSEWLPKETNQIVINKLRGHDLTNGVEQRSENACQKKISRLPCADAINEIAAENSNIRRELRKLKKTVSEKDHECEEKTMKIAELNKQLKNDLTLKSKETKCYNNSNLLHFCAPLSLLIQCFSLIIYNWDTIQNVIPMENIYNIYKYYNIYDIYDICLNYTNQSYFDYFF